MSKRPNFILFITDQHRADYLGSAGHPQLKTPHLDALADAGIAFDRFYVCTPVCMPNRASLMTCRMPAAHGSRANGIPLDRRNVTFVDLLRDAGYKTALIGKSHLQTFSGHPPLVQPPAARDGFHQAGGALREAVRHDLNTHAYKYEERPFWADDTAEMPLPFYGFDHVDLVTGHGDNLGGTYGRWLREQLPDADQYLGEAHQLPHDYTLTQAVRTRLPEELYSTRYISDRAAEWIDAQTDDQPFFLMVSWPDPHHPFNPPGKYWDMYAPEDMALPEAFTRNDWTPPPHVAGLWAAREAGQANLRGMAGIGCTAQEAQEARALTCGMIAMIDDGVGQVRGALDASGRGQNTVQVFTSDHGDQLGDHRLLYKGAEQYDQITRVPFIWADPAAEGEGTRRDQFGQTHDIGATILERARVEPAWGMQGRDLFGQNPRDAAFVHYTHQKVMPGVGQQPNVFTLREGDYRLSIFEGVDWGELYDLSRDPGEFDNLWDDPQHAATRAHLTERALREALAMVDRAPFPPAQA